MGIEIIASGLHPTSISCLQALEWLKQKHDWNTILDIGCGNGILSLAAAGLSPGSTVVSADISAQAVTDTTQQFKEHGLDSQATIIRADGFSDPLIRARAPYDLIICNLLAEPITAWAAQLQSHLASGGYCILSGILAWLSPGVESAYKSLGFEAAHSIQSTPWVTHIMRKTS